MKAVICTKYGPPEVLKLKDIKKPTPKDNEILIKVHTATVTSGDARIRAFNVPPLFWLPFRLFMGVTKPRQNILGVDFSGEVEAVGSSIKKFKQGDKVFGSKGEIGGCYTEYICITEDTIITTKPTNITHEQASTLFFGAHTALHFLRKGNIQSDQKILIYGASGSIGTYAVQLAKYFGAEVTGICSTNNIDLVKSLGADKVIDYTKEDFTKNGETYDIIFDTVGKSPFKGSIKSLNKKGYYLRAVHLYLSSILKGFWVSLTSSKKVIGGVAAEHKEDIVFLTKLLESGKIKTIIDKAYPLEKIVEAHRYVDTGYKKGNVVINVIHKNV